MGVTEPHSIRKLVADEPSPEEEVNARRRGQEAPAISGHIEEGAAFVALAQGSRIANGKGKRRIAPSLPLPGGAASASTEPNS